jgi:uncharacterized protein YuzE
VSVKITYDPEHNVAYLQLMDKEQEVTTIEVTPEINIDVTKDGLLFGIEFLNANAVFKRAKRIVFENTAIRKPKELALT